MSGIPLEILLETFLKAKRITSKGKLALILFLTREFAGKPLPLNPSHYTTSQSGQVKGLGKASVQKILSEHGIYKVLAEEAGRTSRGSLGLMKEYIIFLNSNEDLLKNLRDIEYFWVEKVKSFFAAKPFRLSTDRSLAIYSILKDLISQAENRQRDNPGTTYVGALYQHLVGAKLSVLLHPEAVVSHSYSTADQQTRRSSDFQIGDTAIHVTNFPSEALFRKCESNLVDGLKPLIVTSEHGMPVAEGIAVNLNLKERIEILSLHQFLATNLLEWGRFHSDNQRTAFTQLVGQYNLIIDAHETDPSLRIEL